MDGLQAALLAGLDRALCKVGAAWFLGGTFCRGWVDDGAICSPVAAAAEAPGRAIVDVRTDRTELTDPVLKQSYDRMEVESLTVAERIRARGREAALRTSARVDRSVVVIREGSTWAGGNPKAEGDGRSTADVCERPQARPGLLYRLSIDKSL